MHHNKIQSQERSCVYVQRGQAFGLVLYYPLWKDSIYSHMRVDCATSLLFRKPYFLKVLPPFAEGKPHLNHSIRVTWEPYRSQQDLPWETEGWEQVLLAPKTPNAILCFFLSPNTKI